MFLGLFFVIPNECEGSRGRYVILRSAATIASPEGKDLLLILTCLKGFWF